MTVVPGGRRIRVAHRTDGGMVTAEIAVGFIAVVAVITTVVGVVSTVIAQVRCVDAAYAAARVAARGEGITAAVKRGSQAAPNGASIDVNAGSDSVRSTVVAEVQPLGPLLPTMTVRATAVANREHGTP